MSNESKHPLFPLEPGSISDNIPLLDQVVDINDISLPASTEAQSIDPKILQNLRKQFESEMNKKIRKCLQDTERQLQKEMQIQLDKLFKQITR